MLSVIPAPKPSRLSLRPDVFKGLKLKSLVSSVSTLQ